MYSTARDLVCPLAHGEAGFVHAIVHIVVNEIGELRMLGLDFLREKIQLFSLGEIVKRAVKHPTDVILTVVHNPFCLPVPENGNGHALVVLWIGRSIGFAQKLEAVDRVGGFKRRAGRNLSRRMAKGPAVLISNRIYNSQADRRFPASELPYHY